MTLLFGVVTGILSLYDDGRGGLPQLQYDGVPGLVSWESWDTFGNWDLVVGATYMGGVVFVWTFDPVVVSPYGNRYRSDQPLFI